MIDDYPYCGTTVWRPGGPRPGLGILIGLVVPSVSLPGLQTVGGFQVR